jgi:hypothetical protein
MYEKLLSAAGMSIHYRQLQQLGARGSTTLRGMNDGKPLEL